MEQRAGKTQGPCIRPQAFFHSPNASVIFSSSIPAGPEKT